MTTTVLRRGMGWISCMMLVGFVSAWALLGSTPRSVCASSPSKMEEQIEGRLGDATVIEATEQPLTDVLEELTKEHGIAIKLDDKALEDASIAKDTAITMQLKGVRLESALNLLLHRVGREWVVRNDVLLITTPDAAAQMTETRLYRVTEIMQKFSVDSERVADLVRSSVLLQPQEGEDDGYTGGGLPGNVRHFDRLLIVSAPYQTHCKVQAFLDDLHKKELGPQDNPAKP